MALDYNEHPADCGVRNDQKLGCEGPVMSDALLTLLRYRIASRFYDRPEVIDKIARAIAS